MKDCTCSTPEQDHYKAEDLSPWCVLCGEDENVLTGTDAHYFSLPSGKFCMDCARVIYGEAISPIYAHLAGAVLK